MVAGKIGLRLGKMGGEVHNKKGGGGYCQKFYKMGGGGGPNKMELVVKKSKNGK